MERGRPGTAGAADNTSSLLLVELSFSLLQMERVKATSFGENWRTTGENVVLNTMTRRISFEVRGENCGKSLDKILKRGG